MKCAILLIGIVGVCRHKVYDTMAGTHNHALAIILLKMTYDDDILGNTEFCVTEFATFSETVYIHSLCRCLFIPDHVQH